MNIVTDGEALARPDDDTAPLPLILPDRPPSADLPAAAPAEAPAAEAGSAVERGDGPAVPGDASGAQERPPEVQLARMRAPFEPLEHAPGPAATGPVQPDPTDSVPADTAGAAGTEPEPPPVAEAKMAQIKDLYLTAEAIGEDALARHFQQVSDRQRQLIREYFDQVVAQSADGQPTS